MITYELKNEELTIKGEMKSGEMINGFCCPGFDWGVLLVFPHKDLGYTAVWGVCSNPDCMLGGDIHYHGINHFTQEDIALYLLEKETAN